MTRRSKKRSQAGSRTKNVPNGTNTEAPPTETETVPIVPTAATSSPDTTAITDDAATNVAAIPAAEATAEENTAGAASPNPNAVDREWNRAVCERMQKLSSLSVVLPRPNKVYMGEGSEQEETDQEAVSDNPVTPVTPDDRKAAGFELLDPVFALDDGTSHSTAIAGATPMAVTEATPMAVTEATPMAVTEATPMPVTEATPMPVTEATPMAVTEAIPMAATVSIQMVATEATPKVTTEATPMVTTEATPMVATEATPMAATEATPMAVTKNAIQAAIQAAATQAAVTQAAKPKSGKSKKRPRDGPKVDGPKVDGPKVHNAFMLFRLFLEDTDPAFRALPFREKATEAGRRWQELKDQDPGLYQKFKEKATQARAAATQARAEAAEKQALLPLQSPPEGLTLHAPLAKRPCHRLDYYPQAGGAKHAFIQFLVSNKVSDTDKVHIMARALDEVPAGDAVKNAILYKFYEALVNQNGLLV
jgi:hypothetical protein